MAAVDSDSDLTDVDTLEDAWNLRSPPSPPSPVSTHNSRSTRASTATSSTDTRTTSHDTPAPTSTRPKHIPPSFTGSSTSATSRPPPSSTTRRAAAPPSVTPTSSSKRPRRDDCTSPSATSDDEAARGTGPGEAQSARGARARKRATRRSSETGGEVVDAQDAPLVEQDDTAASASSTKPTRRRRARTAHRLDSLPAAQAKRPAPRLSREFRRLQGATFSHDPAAADELRPARLAALARANPYAEPDEVPHSPEARESPELVGPPPVERPVERAAAPSASAGATPPKRPHSPVPSAAAGASSLHERAQLSKKQRKEAPAPSNTGATPCAPAVPSPLPPSSSSLLPLLKPAPDVPPSLSSPPSTSTSSLWPAAAVVVTPEPLLPRRLSKPPTRYVDEVTEREVSRRSSSSATRGAPSARPAASGVSGPSLEEVGRTARAARRGEGFLTMRPLVVGASANNVDSARSPVLVHPQDPETPIISSTALRPENLPPLPGAPPTAPVAGSSSAPPPPRVASAKVARPAPTKRAVTAASTSSSSTKKVAEASKAPKAPKPRARHPALDSRDSWVPVERDVRMTAAGKPPIWCQGRQELCESVPYFNSYQGGHYDNLERCLGYLLDGFPSPSDACASHGKVIISHGGGCSEVLAVGGARLKADQTRDGVRIRALHNCMTTGTPVVLIAGAKYEHFPKLKDMGKDGVRYAVLGHYLVTDIWAEGEPVEGDQDGNYFVRFKVRFEWLASQGEPWFANVIGKDESSPKIKAVSPELRATSLSPELRGPSSARRLVDAPILPRLGTPSSASLADLATAPPPTSTTSFNRLAGLHFKRVPGPTAPPVVPVVDAGSDMDMSSDDLDSSPPSPRSSRSGHTADSGFVDVTTSAGDEFDKDTCGACGVGYKRVYREDVECYNEKCDKFFLVDGKMPLPGSLTYRASFLDLTPSLASSDVVPQRLTPRTLQSLSGASEIADYSVGAWRGFGCSTCGRLSSRSEWVRLVCAGCGAETDASARTYSADELVSKGKGRALELGGPSKIVAPYKTTPIEGVRGYGGYSVDLSPAEGGGTARVHHLWPVDASASEEGDRLFEEYQKREVGELLRRNKLEKHAATGDLLCQQYTFNSGERYSHVVSMATYPFPSSTSAPPAPSGDASSVPCAPQCALDARDYLKTVVRAVVGDGPETDFNEVLSVAYMTGGKMNYHDDGEHGLGQYVASVSLGSDAIMSFRAKRPRKKGGKPAKEDAVAADDEWDDDATKKKKGKGNASRLVLKTRLKHGHVLIMEGDDMQKLFEHKVEPEGLRFAATARWVGPDHLPSHPQSSSVQPPPLAPATRSSSRHAVPHLPPSGSSGGRPPPSASTAPHGQASTLVPRSARPSPPPSTVASTPFLHSSRAPQRPALRSSSSTSTVRRHPDADIAAHIGAAPHDKRVRDTPRAHPRGSADPPPQLLHSHGPTPARGTSFGPSTTPPDSA
ncbi:hypothetical protein JCM8208_005540 [Rhodotorula glutinis]